MSHFAEISGSNNTVIRVLVAEQDFIDSGAVGSGSDWVQTSYNTRDGVHYGPDGEPDGGTQIRKNFASIGYTYDESRDAFIAPKPFNAWVLNESSCTWDAPISYPNDGKFYKWNDVSGSWGEEGPW